MDRIKIFEKILLDKRGWISKWPKCVVFIYSGGLDSTVTIAKLLEDKGVEVFPLFINRGQSNLIHERRAVKFFTKYFKNNYGKLFHNFKEISVNIPPEEIKNQLRGYSKKFGYPLRNNILQMIGVQYAISLSQKLDKKIESIFCAQLDDDPFPHSKLVSLRSTTVNVCQSLDEWDWQISSPNIDSILNKEKTGKKEMVRWAQEHSLPIEKTRSCYSNNIRHCGSCLTCRRRRKAFTDAGIADMTKYLVDKN
ncbi:MAG: 7-cyano-7-deazaguanine synthase [Nitrospirota bacterium]|nr:7-cyano-7-deazaguanine synthase [Nitrospirota bacterium]